MNEGHSMSETVEAGPSAGILLRRAREAAGLHVAALAVSLKVPVRKLEALEEDRYDLLPDAVFARALASSVCRTLKVDPQPVLERLPQTAKPRLVQDRDGINTPFRAPSDTSRPSPWREQLTKPVFVTVAALLLGALVIIFLPDLRQGETAAAAAKSEPGAPMASPVVMQPVAVEAGAPATLAVSTAAAPAAGPSAMPGVMAASVVAPAAVAAPAVAAGPAAGTVIFRAKGPSWVEVTDSKGVVALRKLMAAGESVGASGTLPLAVTVGSSSNTAVEVRGKPFDLAPVSQDNVARFEVK